MCPSIKVICPKYSDHHVNCEVISFKCVNCSGKHMAPSKECLIFKKEKRIRELMVEFKCTYQKATTIYVPPTPYRRPDRTSASDLWRKIKWMKGYTAQRQYIDSDKAERLLHNLTPDYVAYPQPTFKSQNSCLDIEVTLTELNKASDVANSLYTMYLNIS